MNRTIETTTSLASKKVNKRTSGRKKPVQRRMRSVPLSKCKGNQFSISPHIKTSLSISRPPTSIDLNATSTQKLPFQQNIVYIPPKSYLEQLTSFPQTTFPAAAAAAAAGFINLHPTINQINTTIFEHHLKEIKTDQTVLTLVKLCHPKVSKCYGCGTFLKPNSVIPETPTDLALVSNTLRAYKEKGQIKFSQYPQNFYIKVHDQDPYACLRKKFNFHVEAIKLHGKALLELNAAHVAKILCDCKLVHLAPSLT